MSKNKFLSENAKIIEAILFVENEPVSLEKLEKMTKLSQKEIEEGCKELKKIFDEQMHGLTLVLNKNRYCFVPTIDLNAKLKKAYGKKVDTRLSKAAIETLSIIAYKQPITRREIDNLRGVSSDTIVRILRDREYIKVLGRRHEIGNPCEYGTTLKFLMEFNLNSISELPRLSNIDKIRFSRDDEEEQEEAESLFLDIDDEE